MNKQDITLDIAAACMMIALNAIDKAYDAVHDAFEGDEPGYPYPDSADARAWDYLDALHVAREGIILRLETWDGYIR